MDSCLDHMSRSTRFLEFFSSTPCPQYCDIVIAHRHMAGGYLGCTPDQVTNGKLWRNRSALGFIILRKTNRDEHCKSRNFRWCFIFGNFGAEIFTENKTHQKYRYSTSTLTWNAGLPKFPSAEPPILENTENITPPKISALQ